MSRDADSAGQPWAGRHFDASAFDSAAASDDGQADPDLLVALHDFRSGDAGPDAVVDALRSARLLIPLVAHLGDSEMHEGHLVDKTQELSIVTVTGPDGRTVLPAFSSVDTMRAWNPQARPIPADGARVALAAASEQTDLVVLDPTTESEFVVRRPAVWAIAQAQPWRPSYEDPDVDAAFRESLGRELAVQSVELAAGDPQARMAGPELVVRLHITAGLTKEELDAVLARLGQRWAADDIIATRVDSLRVSLVRSE
jgi:hypothetical protein